MSFTPVPTRDGGYALEEADWDLLKDNFNEGTWVQLADETLTGAASTIDFTSIDGSFAHLLLLAYLRGTTSGTAIEVGARFNNDSGSNYDDQRLTGQGASPGAGEAFGGSDALVGFAPAGLSESASLYSAVRFLVPHYAGTANNKVLLSRWASKTGTSTTTMTAGNAAGFWRSNAAITRLTLVPQSGDFAIGSRATLYGLA
jgi:hypothetical protein